MPLIEYYLGESCLLSSLTSFLKWQDEIGYGETLGLHNGSALARPPHPLDRPHVFNSNWVLTDYTRANWQRAAGLRTRGGFSPWVSLAFSRSRSTVDPFPPTCNPDAYVAREATEDLRTCECYG